MVKRERWFGFPAGHPSRSHFDRGHCPADMPATANSGGGRRHQGLLPDSSLVLLARIDREIEHLRQVAPPDYQSAIASLRATIVEIREALDFPNDPNDVDRR